MSGPVTIRDLQRHKEELLQRYRAARFEEMMSELRIEAEREAELDRWPWKGEFRPREEVLFWYAERKRWDRRFLIDLFVVAVALAFVLSMSPKLIKILLPLPIEAGG